MWLLGFIIVKRLTFSIMCKAINNLRDAAVRFIDMEASCSSYFEIFLPLTNLNVLLGMGSKIWMKVPRGSIRLHWVHQMIIWLYYLHIMDPRVYCPAKHFLIHLLGKLNSYYWKILESAGLGSEPNDICGKDWGFGGGDHGDPGNFLKVSHECIILCLVTSLNIWHIKAMIGGPLNVDLIISVIKLFYLVE